MALLETPSRVWRRIENNRHLDGEMPSLPSLAEVDESHLSGSSNGSAFLFDTPVAKPPPEQSIRKSPPSTVRPAAARMYSTNTPSRQSEASREQSLSALEPSALSDSPTSNGTERQMHTQSHHSFINHITNKGNGTSDTSSSGGNGTPSLSRSETPRSYPSTPSRSTPSADSAAFPSASFNELDEDESPVALPSPVPASASPIDAPKFQTRSPAAPRTVEESLPAFQTPLPGILKNQSTPAPRQANGPITNLATPGLRRTHFLMDVIHSNVRGKRAIRVNSTPVNRISRPRFSAVSIPNSEGETSDDRVSSARGSTPHALHGTPSLRLPQEDSYSPGDRASFISTASSHDLLMPAHVSQNPHISFDPATARNADGGAVSRFDAPRLNTYLHTLNTRLTKENRELVEILKVTQAKMGGDSNAQWPHLSGFAKATEEAEMVEQLRARLDELDQSKIEEVSQTRIEELAEIRANEKLANYEAKVLEEFAALEREYQEECQGLEEAREKDTVEWQQRIQSAQEHAETILQEIESERDEARKQLHATQSASSAALGRIELLEERLRDRESAHQALEGVSGRKVEAMRSAQEVKLEEASATQSQLKQRIETLEAQTEHLVAELNAKALIVEKLERENDGIDPLRNQLGQVKSLQAATEQESTNKIARLEGEIAALKAERKNQPAERSTVQTSAMRVLAEADVERLEEENERLWNDNKALKRQTEDPRQNNSTRLQLENQQLQQQINDLTEAIRDLQDQGTESYARTPDVRKNGAILKTPKTPGLPLRDLSWMNNTTRPGNDPQMIDHIRQLEKQLHLANESIDGKVRLLEEQGHSKLGFESQLERVRAELLAAESELHRLRVKEETWQSQLASREKRLESALSRCEQLERESEAYKASVNQVEFRCDTAERNLGDSRAGKYYRDACDTNVSLIGSTAQEAVKHKVGRLESQLSESRSIMERLRTEKKQDDSRYAQLKSHLSETEKEVDALRQQLEATQKLLSTLEAQGQAATARAVANLEGSLEKAHADANQFRVDLRKLREEKLAVEHVQQERAVQSEQNSDQDSALRAQEIQHKEECHGLLVQITYLQHKWMREANMRSELRFTKSYLLSVMGDVGIYPRNQPSQRRKYRKLRSVAVAVLFMVGARKAACLWRQQRECRAALEAALQDVHRRRAVA